jgi:phage shock protein B
MHVDHLLSVIAVIGGLLVTGLVVLLPVLIVSMVLRAKGKSSKGAMNQEELRLVQQIHASLADMERRIEALETILLERFRER